MVRVKILIYLAFAALFFQLCYGKTFASKSSFVNFDKQIKALNDLDNHDIYISNQSEFDSLNYLILKYTNLNGCINVYLAPGRYYYHDRHINLSNIDNTSLTINIYSDSACFISSGDDFVKTKRMIRKNNSVKCHNKVTIDDCFLSEELQEISVLSETEKCLSQVEVVDSIKRICRVLTSYKSDCSEMSILITSWFKSHVYQITSSKNGWLYFIADDLQYKEHHKHFNVDMDHGWAGVFPRYKLINDINPHKIYWRNQKLHIPKEYKKIHRCSYSNFLTMDHCKIKQFHLSGVCFLGNCASFPLISLKYVDCDGVFVNNCVFKYIKSVVLDVRYSNNVIFDNNIIEYCYEDCIVSHNGCKNTTISNNYFYNNGLRFKQHNCISCQSENFNIHHNKICNFTYAAIRIGEHYRNHPVYPNKGIIEYNEIWYDSTFINNNWKYTLMDGGAIYVATINNGTVIRNNLIHDYIGMKNNRGIFCDDGSGNISIFGNLIYNIMNDNAIDLRRTSVADDYWPNCNNNNMVGYNIIAGSYKFCGDYNKENTLFANIILNQNNNPRNETSRLTVKEKDIYIDDYILKDNKVLIRDTIFKRIKPEIRDDLKNFIVVF